MSPKPYTLRVLNRPGKKPIAKLPDTIEITAATTVEDAKKQIAKAVGISDFNRVAILDVDKQGIFKDRNALLAQQKAVADSYQIMVKDLGPQISWRTCYLIEYAGPIFIHLSALFLRPYIYRGVSKSDSLSSVQTLALDMYVLHYIKRELETIFVHKFSSSTMPFRNVFKNSFHYWILGGVNVAYWVYAPDAVAANTLTNPLSIPIIYLGFVLWVFGELGNLYTHIVLSNLRSPGGTERGIPTGFGFNLVTCPNYMFEILSMIGLTLVTGSLSQAIFTGAGWYQMQEWAQGKEQRYRKDFGGKYKPKRYPLTPGIPAWPTKSKQ